MKCNITTCSNYLDCVILDIIKKMPKDKCSYYKTQAQADKTEKKLKESVTDKKYKAKK